MKRLFVPCLAALAYTLAAPASAAPTVTGSKLPKAKPIGPAPTSKVKPKAKPLTAKTTATATLSPPIPPRTELIVNRGINAKRASIAAGITSRHVLSRFSFEFNKGDRHLDAIGVTVANGGINTIFGDREYNAQDTQSRIVFDNPYADFLKRGGDAYTIDHRWIELEDTVQIGQVIRQTCSSGGACRVEIPPKPGHVRVLRGFELDFDQDDRHIKQLSILPTSYGYRVFYGDQSPDDPYRVSIQYAWVPSAWLTHGDEPAGGWGVRQEPGGVAYNLPKNGSSNFAIGGFEFMHPDAQTWNEAIGKTGQRHEKLDQDDGHVRAVSVRWFHRSDARFIDARMRDDQFPAYGIRLWMVSIDPKRVKNAPAP